MFSRASQRANVHSFFFEMRLADFNLRLLWLVITISYGFVLTAVVVKQIYCDLTWCKERRNSDKVCLLYYGKNMETSVKDKWKIVLQRYSSFSVWNGMAEISALLNGKYKYLDTELWGEAPSLSVGLRSFWEKKYLRHSLTVIPTSFLHKISMSISLKDLMNCAVAQSR